MAQTLLHMLGELFGMKNYSPPSATEAHFTLESNGMSYILDAHMTEDSLLLCLSRPLLPHEERDEELVKKAQTIAHKHPHTHTFCKNSHISFMQKVPLSTSMAQLEESLLQCTACQNALREE